jgi:hypothetical protein
VQEDQCGCFFLLLNCDSSVVLPARGVSPLLSFGGVPASWWSRRAFSRLGSVRTILTVSATAAAIVPPIACSFTSSCGCCSGKQPRENPRHGPRIRCQKRRRLVSTPSYPPCRQREQTVVRFTTTTGCQSVVFGHDAVLDRYTGVGCGSKAVGRQYGTRVRLAQRARLSKQRRPFHSTEDDILHADLRPVIQSYEQ